MVLVHPGIELFHPYVNPTYADIDKPTVDLARPVSITRREDWAEKGCQPGFIMPNSLNHFMSVKEQIPYTDTFSTSECCYFGFCMANMYALMYFMARHGAACINLANPRTRWAHTLHLQALIARCNIAVFLGWFGYFYTYEFAYTYIPGMKIPDPSIEGWKNAPIDPTHYTTFSARNLASLWVLPAHAFFTRGTKRTVVWWLIFSVCNNYYEFARCFVLSGTGMLGYTSAVWSEKQARFGSLIPNTKQEVDPDTGRTFNSAANPIQMFGAKGWWPRQMKQNMNHEYSPFTRQGLALPNPYYNPMKAGTMWNKPKGDGSPVNRYTTETNPRPAFQQMF